MPVSRRLTNQDSTSLRQTLASRPDVNLFLLAFLEHQPIHLAHWHGEFEEGLLKAVALVIPGRVVVPWSTCLDAAHRLGRSLSAYPHPPSLLVGPRETSDALWSGWGAPDVPRRWHDQRLYVAQEPSDLPSPKGFRLARPEDWPVVARLSARMNLEDMGVDPYRDNVLSHEKNVRERILGQRVYVIERGQEIVFQMHVGTQGAHGCQVAGTYVRPEHRGQHIATLGVAELTRRLLRDHPRVTLHVNEANTPAVFAYERAGYQRSAAFRLAVP